MALSLGNPLANSSSPIIISSNKLIKQTGDSMSSGIKQNNSAVDNYLGKGLQDSKLMLTAINQNMNYSLNLLDTAGQYYNSVANALQSGINAVVSAGSLSDDKLVILQESLDQTKKQIGHYINNASFDGRKLFSGDAVNMDVKTGTGSEDKIAIHVRDISEGKLFRLTILDVFNDYFAADHTRTYGVYTSDTLKTAVENNENLFMTIYASRNLTEVDFNQVMYNVIRSDPSISTVLTKINPITDGKLKAQGLTFSTANQNQLFAAFMRNNLGNQDQAGAVELADKLQDSQEIKIGNEVEREITYNVWNRALNFIRAEQASLAVQRNNVLKASGAVGASADITGQVADSYLKTDYVKAAQTFSELLKQMQAAIAAMQANEQVSEAALSLVQGLDR